MFFAVSVPAICCSTTSVWSSDDTICATAMFQVKSLGKQTHTHWTVQTWPCKSMEWFSNASKSAYEASVMVGKPKKLLHLSFGSWSRVHWATFSVNVGSVLTPLAGTVCPRNGTCGEQKVHLLGFSLSPAPPKRSKASFRFFKCSLKVLLR